MVTDDQVAGTTGSGLPIEAVKIQLIGQNASKYDIYYRTYVQNIGWLDWAKNGISSGSDTYGLEAYQVAVLPVGSEAPGDTIYTYHTIDMKMQAHVQISAGRIKKIMERLLELLERIKELKHIVYQFRKKI